MSPIPTRTIRSHSRTTFSTRANRARRPSSPTGRTRTQTSVYYEAQHHRPQRPVWTVPGSVTTDSFLTIQPNMKGHQIVTIRPEQVDFASVHVTEVDVQLRYEDAKNKLSTAGVVQAGSAERCAALRLRLPGPVRHARSTAPTSSSTTVRPSRSTGRQSPTMRSRSGFSQLDLTRQGDTSCCFLDRLHYGGRRDGVSGSRRSEPVLVSARARSAWRRCPAATSRSSC